MIKYGLKIWSKNKEWFKEATALVKSGKADFIELYMIPDSFKLSELNILRGIPTTLHAPHCDHDFNIFELDDEKVRFFKNRIIQTADFLNSQFIILHSGVGRLKENFKKNIAKICDKRILIENMCKISINDRVCFGYSLEQLKFIKEKCGLDICFDFGHASKSAFSQKLDYKDFITSLIYELNPYYFHISGVAFDTKKDEHLNLFEGDFDISWAKGIIRDLAKSRDIYLVFETPKQGTLVQDIENINYFRNL